LASGPRTGALDAGRMLDAPSATAWVSVSVCSRVLLHTSLRQPLHW
jgi:hypothetical protein